MIPEQRREKILEKLRQRDIYTIDNLTRELKVSRITIQRDVSILVERGTVEKVHGGVRMKKDLEKKIESRFSMRMQQNLEGKIEIANKALEFVKDASIIFLDSSTTVYIFARELLKKKFLDLNIITTSPAILCDSLDYPEIKMVATGGELRTAFNMFAGNWVIDFLNNVNINSAFISAAGVTPEGEVTSNNRELANTIITLFSRSEEVNLLVDSSKLYRQGMLGVATLQECKRIITDKNIDKRVLSDLKKIKDLEIVY
jgi:DeoR family myo-inositol catabolism operon transcriptional repressor